MGYSACHHLFQGTESTLRVGVMVGLPVVPHTQNNSYAMEQFDEELESLTK